MRLLAGEEPDPAGFSRLFFWPEKPAFPVLFRAFPGRKEPAYTETARSALIPAGSGTFMFSAAGGKRCFSVPERAGLHRGSSRLEKQIRAESDQKVSLLVTFWSFLTCSGPFLVTFGHF